MTRLSSRLSLALALGAVGLWSVSSAVAATQTVTLKSTKGDQATITLNQQTKNAFKKNHIALKTNKPATRKGNNANFPEKSGKWNFSNTSGNVTYNGVTRFVRGKRSVKLTKLSFTRTVKGKKSTATLTAFFGKNKVTLLTLTGKVKVRMKGAKETVSGLHGQALQEGRRAAEHGPQAQGVQGQPEGRLILADADQSRDAGHAPTPPAPGAAGAPGTPGASASGVTVAFTPAFESALGSSGLSVTPLGPAANTVVGGLSGVTLPLGDGTTVTVPGIGGAPAAQRRL